MHWTIISVIVGGAVAAASGILTAYLQHRHERRSLLCAFAGEVGAIVAIVRRRNYLGLIDDHLAATRRGEKVVHKAFTGTHSFMRIYEANAGRIGMLPRGQAGDVARFYTTAISLLEDVTANRPDGASADASVKYLTELKEMVVDLLELGDGILTRLQCVR